MVRMRLLFVNHATAVGGGERSMLELAAALDRKRYRVAFAIPGPGPLAEALSAAGEAYYFYHAEPALLTFSREGVRWGSPACWRMGWKTLAVAARLRKILKAERPDVVHTHSQKAHVFAAVAVLGTGVPVVWHMRDLFERDSVAAVMDFLAAARADAVIGISEAVRRQFKLARRKVSVIYNAAARPAGGPPGARADLKRELGLPADARLVGCVGQLAPWKGQAVFLEAAGKISRRIPDVYFTVVGSPLYGAHQYRAALVRAARDAGLAARVLFLGQRADAPELIGAFDVLVHTPLAPEPFGRVLVEAMARGVPVVASRCGGITEIIEDGREGFLVPAGNAATAAAATSFLLENRKVAALMGAHGRRTYERRFTPERLAAEVAAVYYGCKAGGERANGARRAAAAAVPRRTPAAAAPYAEIAEAARDAVGVGCP